MKKLVKDILYFIFICCLFSCKKQNSPGNEITPPPTPPTVYEWKFDTTSVWSDEFNTGSKSDPSKWGHDIGGNGWGNNELQYYTDGQNDTISNGSLKIVAKKVEFSNTYTSSRMVTKNKGDWLYGRFEIKAKIPKGRGTWPAIWMLPTDNAYGGWPKSGEIDIMEHVGYDLNNIHFTLHAEAFYGANGKGASKYVLGATDDFHLYRLDWAPYGIRGYIDNEKIFEYANYGSSYSYWPFDKKFHLLLNIAVGGNWGGAQGIDDSIFPATMEIDYVRVYSFIK